MMERWLLPLLKAGFAGGIAWFSCNIAAAADVPADAAQHASHTTETSAAVSEIPSLMFSNSDMEQMNNAMHAADTGEPLHPPPAIVQDTRQSLLDALKAQPHTSVVDPNAATAAPQFHITNPMQMAPVFQLQSLLFLGKHSWMIVVNGVTITSETLPEDKKVEISWEGRDTHLEAIVKVVEVTSDTVALSWSSSWMSELVPDVMQKLTRIPKGFVNADRTIMLNQDRSQVLFLLRMNQLFSLYEMNIKERGIDGK